MQRSGNQFSVGRGSLSNPVDISDRVNSFKFRIQALFSVDKFTDRMKIVKVRSHGKKFDHQSRRPRGEMNVNEGQRVQR